MTLPELPTPRPTSGTEVPTGWTLRLYQAVDAMRDELQRMLRNGRNSSDRRFRSVAVADVSALAGTADIYLSAEGEKSETGATVRNLSGLDLVDGFALAALLDWADGQYWTIVQRPITIEETTPPLNTQYATGGINKTFYRLSDSASYDVLLDDTIDYRARHIECWIKQTTSANTANPTVGETLIMPSIDVGEIVGSDAPYDVYVKSTDGSLNVSGSAAATEWAVIWIRASAPFAATTCPSADWPGTSAEGWPSGGLVRQYIITDTMISPYDAEIILGRTESYFTSDCSGTPDSWTEYRLKTTSVTVTAIATSCAWQALDVLEFRDSEGPYTDWIDMTVNLDLALVDGKWAITQFIGLAKIGLTPVGDMAGDVCADETIIDPASVRTYGSATVAEAT